MDDNYYKQYEPIFGSWYIKKKLGEGSFGKVYEIEREDFNKTYKDALKIITIPNNKSEIKSIMSEGMDEASVTSYYESVVEDIVSEFEIMSKLKGNSHIVSYADHKVIKHRDGIGWDILIRMELLTPLLDYLKDTELKRKDVIKLGIDICKALELCQKYNIIHRDIKPENIFVSKTGDFKLGDFGIARTLEQTNGVLSKKGTQTYMAPEICREENYISNVDIYSLGIVMYRMLNEGRTPFLPPYPEKITYQDRDKAIKKRISGAEIPVPKNSDGRLAEIVLKACSYNPKERYFSPKDMRDDLQAILYDKGEGEIIYEGDDSINVQPNVSNEDRENTKGIFFDRLNDTEKKDSEIENSDNKEEDNIVHDDTEGIFRDKGIRQKEETKPEILQVSQPKNRKKKFAIIICVIAFVILSLLALSINIWKNRPIEAKSIVLENKDTITLMVGDTDNIEPALNPVEAAGSLVFKSESPEVASIDETGAISALSAGESKIRIIYDRNEDLYKEIQVTVIEKIDRTDLTTKYSDAKSYLDTVTSSTDIDQANVAYETQYLQQLLTNYDISAIPNMDLSKLQEYKNDYDMKISTAVSSLKTAYDKALEVEKEKKEAAKKTTSPSSTGTKSSTSAKSSSTGSSNSSSTNSSSSTSNTSSSTNSQTSTQSESQAVCPVCGSKYHTVHPSGTSEIENPSFETGTNNGGRGDLDW